MGGGGCAREAVREGACAAAMSARSLSTSACAGEEGAKAEWRERTHSLKFKSKNRRSRLLSMSAGVADLRRRWAVKLPAGVGAGTR